MAYMEREPAVRSDIRSWYPQARCVVLCAFSYASNEKEPSVPGRGRVARYARLPDYHPELKRRLTELLEWLKAQSPGADGRVFVDTSPILERLHARYAGLGWIAKNTMLIGPRLGSYFLLAGLAVNLDLPSDRAEPDHCGTCTRCLDACPTDAFPSPRTLDASKCISYLTIERKGPVPEELREGVGDWVFGCDVCQEVCPWNRFARPGPAFAASGPASLDLAETASLDAAGFKARYKGTPLERPKRKGLARNAALALGNNPGPGAAAALEKAARDAEPLVAEQASWSLKRPGIS
jgi:epoxyqueuosine reductase